MARKTEVQTIAPAGPGAADLSQVTRSYQLALDARRTCQSNEEEEFERPNRNVAAMQMWSDAYDVADVAVDEARKALVSVILETGPVEAALALLEHLNDAMEEQAKTLDAEAKSITGWSQAVDAVVKILTILAAI